MRGVGQHGARVAHVVLAQHPRVQFHLVHVAVELRERLAQFRLAARHLLERRPPRQAAPRAEFVEGAHPRRSTGANHRNLARAEARGNVTPSGEAASRGGRLAKRGVHVQDVVVIHRRGREARFGFHGERDAKHEVEFDGSVDPRGSRRISARRGRGFREVLTGRGEGDVILQVHRAERERVDVSRRLEHVLVRSVPGRRHVVGDEVMVTAEDDEERGGGGGIARASTRRGVGRDLPPLERANRGALLRGRAVQHLQVEITAHLAPRRSGIGPGADLLAREFGEGGQHPAHVVGVRGERVRARTRVQTPNDVDGRRKVIHRARTLDEEGERRAGASEERKFGVLARAARGAPSRGIRRGRIRRGRMRRLGGDELDGNATGGVEEVLGGEGGDGGDGARDGGGNGGGGAGGDARRGGGGGGGSTGEVGVDAGEGIRGDAVLGQVELVQEHLELPLLQAEAGVRGEDGGELGPARGEERVVVRAGWVVVRTGWMVRGAFPRARKGSFRRCCFADRGGVRSARRGRGQTHLVIVPSLLLKMFLATSSKHSASSILGWGRGADGASGMPGWANARVGWEDGESARGGVRRRERVARSAPGRCGGGHVGRVLPDRGRVEQPAGRTGPPACSETEPAPTSPHDERQQQQPSRAPNKRGPTQHDGAAIDRLRGVAVIRR